MIIKCIVKLSNTSYHSLFTSGAFNISTISFNTCFYCDSFDHGVGILPHRKYQMIIVENNNNIINMKQIQGGSGGGKNWANCSNKKVWTNKDHKQRQINNTENGNVDTKSNKGVHLVDGECMCLCNKDCGFNTYHTTGFHDTRGVYVKNNQPFTLLSTHSFKIKWYSKRNSPPSRF